MTDRAKPGYKKHVHYRTHTSSNIGDAATLAAWADRTLPQDAGARTGSLLHCATLAAHDEVDKLFLRAVVGRVHGAKSLAPSSQEVA